MSPRSYDEAREPSGRPRAHYARVLAELERIDLAAASRRVEAHVAERGVSFGEGGGPFVLDPVPRILTADEWRPLARGLAQRVQALEAFIRDAYGAREIVAAGVVPEEVIDGSEHFEPSLRGRLPEGPLLAVAGLDVVRDDDGRFQVLEDNVRTPSGVAYVAEARQVLQRCLSLPGEPWPIDPVGDLCRALRSAGDRLAVLTDGPENSAYFEHRAIARAAGAPLVTLADLEVRDGRLHANGERVDVVYRRTNSDSMTGGDGRPTAVAEALAEPWLRGHVRVLNAFGAGVADDKLAHAYVEDMVRFYLGEDPLVSSVPTHDPSDPGVRERALGRLDELVVKPRAESGGEGVVIGPRAERDERERAGAALRSQPDAHVVQETLWLSSHPTVAGGLLAPRHVDLRAFVVRDGEAFRTLPGGLTRFARAEGELVVNSSQGGGAKDTWIVG